MFDHATLIMHCSLSAECKYSDKKFSNLTEDSPFQYKLILPTKYFDLCKNRIQTAIKR